MADKVAATYHPSVRTAWICEHCAAVYTSPLAAAECCDPAWEHGTD